MKQVINFFKAEQGKLIHKQWRKEGKRVYGKIITRRITPRLASLIAI